MLVQVALLTQDGKRKVFTHFFFTWRTGDTYISAWTINIKRTFVSSRAAGAQLTPAGLRPQRNAHGLEFLGEFELNMGSASATSSLPIAEENEMVTRTPDSGIRRSLARVEQFIDNRSQKVIADVCNPVVALVLVYAD